MLYCFLCLVNRNMFNDVNDVIIMAKKKIMKQIYRNSRLPEFMKCHVMNLVPAGVWKVQAGVSQLPMTLSVEKLKVSLGTL